MRHIVLFLLPALVLAGGLTLFRVVRGGEVKAATASAEFDCPPYPGAYRFKFAKPDPESRSVAYMVKNGTVDQIAAHYRRAMAEKGYQAGQDTPITLPAPTDKPGPGARRVRGHRLVFTSKAENRVVVLTAIEQPFQDANAQVAMVYGPLSRVRPAR